MKELKLPDPIEEPSLKRKREIYSLYKVIRGTKFEITKKRTLLTCAFAYEPWGWRVRPASDEFLVRKAVPSGEEIGGEPIRKGKNDE